VITNSDGGAGYTAERFQTAFSQSEFPVLNQLDTYHVAQAIIRTFGGGKSEIKEQIRKAIRTHDLDQFTLYLDTHESTLTDKKALKKIKEFRSYILKNWDRIFDWRDRVKNVPEGARGLGAMESNQRHISFRMKKRGMHWSELGAEAMVKIKQGILNGTFKQNIRAFVLSLDQWGLIVEAREIYETPAGKASQERPRSEVRARRLAGRPRKASEFRAPQHPRYPSLYENTTSFPKITPSK
ncbi:UPF0236 family transposase-like protein, partial [Heyndrickxia coagulans]